MTDEGDRPSYTGVVPGRATGRSDVPRRPSTGRARRFGELLALTAFAIAQPVLDVTGRSPDFFLYRRSTPGQLRVLLLLVVAGPPVLLWLAEEVAGLVSAAATRAVHHASMVLLLAAVVVQVGKHARVVTGIPLAVLALAAGTGLAASLARRPAFRQAVLYATPAPLVFALLFATVSPAGALVRPGHGDSRVRALAAKRPPIVFVMFDELPIRALLDDAGKVDARLFPNFARLAARSTWYPNASGVSGWTPYAVPAMLTGRYPQQAVAPSYLEYPQNLFTLLRHSYDVRAFESIAQLCPPDVCTSGPAGRPTGLAALVRDTAGVAREIASPYPASPRDGAEFGETRSGESPTFRFGQAGANQPQRLTTFIDGLAPRGRPTFDFLHLVMPHVPWRFLPSGRLYDGSPLRFVLPKPPENSAAKMLAVDPAVSLVQRQRLLLQLVYTDGLLGQLLDRMARTGLLDEALLVVTADHGEGLAPSAHWRFLDDRNAADLAWVPLFVKTPGQRSGLVDPRNEEHVDLVPTIADLLDVRVPWQVDGRSLYGPERPMATKRWYDVPGRPRTIETAGWLAKAHRGIAERTARPDRGVHGLFAVGSVEGSYGVTVESLTRGSPATVRATLDGVIDIEHVSPASGSVPAMLYGNLSGPVPGASRWLAVSVNGTVAGAVVATQGLRDHRWRFMGMVDDRFFVEGRNDVRMYIVEGSVLHPLASIR